MRILVVEDENEIADGISHILEKAGYKIDCVLRLMSANLLLIMWSLIILQQV